MIPYAQTTKLPRFSPSLKELSFMLTIKEEMAATAFLKHFEPLTIKQILKHQRLRPMFVYVIWRVSCEPPIKELGQAMCEKWGIQASYLNKNIEAYIRDEKDPYLRMIAENIIRDYRNLK